MKIDILTLFPEMFSGFKNESIIKRAIEEKKVSINTINFRDYSKNKHKKVDDTPYGGGSGMVLTCQPIFDAVEDIKKKNSKVILLSPQGKTFNQEMAYDLSKEKHLILICGHYEGFDERIKTICDEEISIGDYVLTGGEIPAMVLCDSVTRLIPGVIEEDSHLNDSFNDNLLDYPTYTKPRNYKGMKVPDILLSGDHKKIEKWRNNERLKVTADKRPDLIKKHVKLEKTGVKKQKNKIYVDDIKNIKVTEIKNVSKTGKYILIKDDVTRAITIFNPKKINGYKLRGKASNTNKIIVVKKSFATSIIMKNIKRKTDMLTYKFNIALSQSEDDDDASANVLGEAEMLKSFIIAAYAKYLGVEKLDQIVKKINTLVNEYMKARTIKTSFMQEREISSRRR